MHDRVAFHMAAHAPMGVRYVSMPPLMISHLLGRKNEGFPYCCMLGRHIQNPSQHDRRQSLKAAHFMWRKPDISMAPAQHTASPRPKMFSNAMRHADAQMCEPQSLPVTGRAESLGTTVAAHRRRTLRHRPG